MPNDSGHTAQSFGPTPSSPLALNTPQAAGSDLFTALSLHSSHTPKRGDLNPSANLEKFLLSSDRNGSRGPRGPRGANNGLGGANGFLGTDADPAYIDTNIWGTTVNIEDVIGVFRDFVLNYQGCGLEVN